MSFSPKTIIGFMLWWFSASKFESILNLFRAWKSRFNHPVEPLPDVGLWIFPVNKGWVGRIIITEVHRPSYLVAAIEAGTMYGEVAEDEHIPRIHWHGNPSLALIDQQGHTLVLFVLSKALEMRFGDQLQRSEASSHFHQGGPYGYPIQTALGARPILVCTYVPIRSLLRCSFGAKRNQGLRVHRGKFYPR